MARDLFWLSDDEWARIEPHLPRGRRGARRVDDRRVISGVIHMLKSGARWRDCPADYGPYTTIYNRFNRWSKQGVWQDVFHALSGSSGVIGTTAVDSTYVKAVCPQGPRPLDQTCRSERGITTNNPDKSHEIYFTSNLCESRRSQNSLSAPQGDHP